MCSDQYHAWNQSHESKQAEWNSVILKSSFYFCQNVFCENCITIIIVFINIIIIESKKTI